MLNETTLLGIPNLIFYFDCYEKCTSLLTIWPLSTAASPTVIQLNRDEVHPLGGLLQTS